MKLPKITVRPGGYIGCAAAILILPIRWLCCAAIAVLVHELAHMAALCLLRIPIRQVEIGLTGAKIHIPDMSPDQEILCAAAGPFASLMLLFLTPVAPMAALFGLVQGLFNLLPIYPLDGGRIFRGILTLAKTAHCRYNSVE